MVEGEGDGGVDDDDGDHSEKAKQEEIRRDMELMALFDGAEAPITPIIVSPVKKQACASSSSFSPTIG